ncbi:DNA polymerase III subunit delta [Aerococcaceae bacterium NML160702]|nr:DNA polymerase III subunit delta [Aerococcaceae bacterium NML160702]
MEYQKAIQAIQKGQVPPVVPVVGTEYFLQQEFLHTLLKQFGETDTLDLSRVDLEEQTIDDVLDEAEMFSFFAEYRLIIVENASFLGTQSKQKLTDTQQERLTHYIQSPNEMSVIVFLMPIEQLDKRKKLTKLFQQETMFVDVAPMSEKDVQQYMRRYLEADSLQLTRDALQELLVRTDYQLTNTMNEVAKLRNFEGEITLAVIQALVPRTLESDVFELTKAVLNRRVERAVNIYRDLVLLKHEPIALHALLVSQFRLMLQTKLLSQQGFLEGDIAKQLSAHPYRVKLALQEAGKYPVSRLVAVYQELIAMDYHMKTGVGLRDIQFDLLLVKLVSNAI